MEPGDAAARPSSPARPSPEARRGRRILIRALAALAVGALLVEIALRTLLFVDVPGMRKVSIRLRQPGNFFQKEEPGYWTTSTRFTPEDRLRPTPNYDPVIGWTGSLVTPGTYEHADEALLLTRRPVLLYGDSFAECTTSARECWQGLLQSSEFKKSHLLLNYGVGGFGMDQSILMLRESLERFAERDPVVILSVFVDDDLSRMVLPFRGWPKPRFTVADGKLVQPEPVPDGAIAFAEDNAPFVLSWTWRYLRHTVDRLAPEPIDTRPEIEELSRLLLTELRDDMAAREQDWFVLLFQGESITTAASRAAVWQHDFLAKTLRELGIPFVTVRRELQAYSATQGASAKALFEQKGRGKGHYTALGNRIVFPSILRGLRGEFD